MGTAGPILLADRSIAIGIVRYDIDHRCIVVTSIRSQVVYA